MKRKPAAAAADPIAAAPINAEDKLLTPTEVSQRYEGKIAVGTLKNWRYLKCGPPFVRPGRRRVFYPLSELIKWEQARTVGRCK